MYASTNAAPRLKAHLSVWNMVFAGEEWAGGVCVIGLWGCKLDWLCMGGCYWHFPPFPTQALEFLLDFWYVFHKYVAAYARRLCRTNGVKDPF
jgi:hypothetical protein